ncbi:hypothetical protein Salat_1436000 [Sesamum alatum]|uniref:Uncharacterized protein n=1 Tax=Sesamum alatum TaxID=300844 RepID=A0AAE1YBP4_9LAMI|nr:hypothetical protein Salat_1436000 [Sesamum alatum]
MRGGEGEMADAVRCGEGNREDEVVEDEFSDSIELEDNDVDLEDDDAEKRFEVVRDVDVRDASADSESESDEDMVGSGDDFESKEKDHFNSCVAKSRVHICWKPAPYTRNSKSRC